MEISYRFPAVRGLQAGNVYYIAMISMKYLVKLFASNEELDLQPEFRAQRKINESRIPEIKKYILENRMNYVFSALSASIDGQIDFEPSQGSSNNGFLVIDMDAIFLINDGQHRRAAIEAAMKEDESLGEDTIAIVFFQDHGLSRSQQMFTDLNKHAVKTSNSLSTLYDTRDDLAVATKEIISRVEFLNRFTDKERDILGKNSSKLFTLNNIYRANKKILHGKECSKLDMEFIVDYWQTLSNNIVEWNELILRELSKKELRENYILTLAITLNAFGRLGSYFYANQNIDMHAILGRLKQINWLRNDTSNWQHRVVRQDGKILNNDEAIVLTCSKIKQLIGIELNKEEQSKEERFTNRLK